LLQCRLFTLFLISTIYLYTYCDLYKFIFFQYIEIPTVDWDSYIAKGVPAEDVAAIRASFEAKTYPEPTQSASVAAVEEFGREYVARLEPNTEKAANLLNDLTGLKKKLEEDFVTMKDWEAEDWARRFPGLVDKIRANHLVGDITNDEHETQYLNLDLKQLAEDVRVCDIYFFLFE